MWSATSCAPHYPRWSDERVYQTARLIVSALIAKIHTVEWTPAILATKAIDIGMNTNWNGPPSHDWLTRLGIWLIDAHAATGIPTTRPDHHGAPYSLTEDFVTVYRMHPLMPDDYLLHDHRYGRAAGPAQLPRHPGRQGRRGAAHDRAARPCSIRSASPTRARSRLHNFPARCRLRARRRAHRPVGGRHRAHPPARRAPLQRLPRRPAQAADQALGGAVRGPASRSRRLREVYRNIDEVDTMVGLFAETPPEGFGFSDTAFRIFILMASRRLQSDRFLTVDFRPEIYSPFGMDWIANNGMTSVILRHCPELRRCCRATRAPSRRGGRVAAGHGGEEPDDRPADRHDASGPRRAVRAAAAGDDLAPPHPPGQPRQLGHGRLDELPVVPAPQPLSELEEAVLIAVTGCTGLTMPDRPFADPRNGTPIMAKPNLNMAGRTAGSPDNAQGTHFFLINDSGTYFLRKLPPAERRRLAARPGGADRAGRAGQGAGCSTAASTCRTANRDFPAYLDSNRFLSNLPGTTILFPVVDLSRQYINGLMYLLTQPEGARPTIVDDRNFYRVAGVKKWVKNGFLNEEIKLPLGAIWADAHPDRGGPAPPEPDADRRRDGSRRVDPRRRSRRPSCWATRSSARPTATCSASTGSCPGGSRWTCCAGTCRCRGYADLRGQRGRPAPQGRAADQGHVPAQLRRPWPTRWTR